MPSGPSAARGRETHRTGTLAFVQPVDLGLLTAVSQGLELVGAQVNVEKKERPLSVLTPRSEVTTGENVLAFLPGFPHAVADVRK